MTDLITHEVFSQSTALVDANLLTGNRTLQDALRFNWAGFDAARFAALDAEAGSATMQPHARLAIAHHQPTAMSSDDAIAVAASATAHAPVSVAPGLDFDAGQAITVAATDYGSDPVSGTLVGLSSEVVTLRLQDPRAGTMQVHFPRFGFQIKKDTSA
jgi:hypothetical protein